MIIAIDGPAGSGKSTVAKKIAEDLHIVFLNSGSFYRGITYNALKKGFDLSSFDAAVDGAKLTESAKSLKIDYVSKDASSRLFIDGEDVEDFLHSAQIDAVVAQVSAVPALREVVNQKIKSLSKLHSIVCEGRDMTTVVFPDANFKFYLDASIDVQAERRFNEYAKKGENTLSLAEIKEAIQKRDEIDKNKSQGALKIAKDAVYIDTSHLTIDEVCGVIKDAIAEKKITDKKVIEKGPIMDDIQSQLQERYFETFESLVEGQLVDGTVVQVTQEQVFIDIGYKSEGKISVSEFSVIPAIGDAVTVVLVSKENKHGEIVVSKTKADAKNSVKNLRQAFHDGTPIPGKILKSVKGGYDVEIEAGTHAFLPISQADIQKVEDAEALVGISGLFYVERLYSDNRLNVVVNRRRYMEEVADAKRAEFFERAKIGDVIKGTVKSFTSFGAFIDLGGFDGLLHVNDMSWGHVTRPKNFVKRGQEVELKLIRLDPSEKRINLSLKHLTDDPWVRFEEKYHVGDVVTGTVAKLIDFGAFIELEPGIEGLAHISEFSWTKKINKPDEVVKIGDSVECKILGYDIQAGRVSIGLKQVTENPWDSIAERYPEGTKITRKITKTTHAGAFIEIEEGISGFLSVDNLDWTKKGYLSGLQEFKAGQEIETIVIACESEAHQIQLSVKHLTENPWELFLQKHPVGSVFEGEVVSFTDFGIFVRAPEGIEGLVNKSNLSEDDEPYEEAVKKYSEGSKINVFVVDVNPMKQKASFSVRKFKKRQKEAEIAQYMSSAASGNDSAFTLGDLLKNKN